MTASGSEFRNPYRHPGSTPKLPERGKKHGGHRRTENFWSNQVAPIVSSARATFGQLTRLPSRKMVGMKSTNWIRIIAWACLLGGVLIIAWQAASGGGSDKVFNIGLVAMITGSV